MLYNCFKLCLESLLNSYIILNDDTDSDVIRLNNAIYNSTSDESITDIIANFINENTTILINKAKVNICKDYGGIMTGNNSSICMFTKDNCTNDVILPPPPDCQTIPDPTFDKCNNPNNAKAKKVCRGYLSYVGENDIL